MTFRDTQLGSAPSTEEPGPSQAAEPEIARAQPLKPVILVLHQPHSNPGHIGQWFANAGYPLDIRRPRYGDPLPATLDNHAAAVIFGGPMSANDADEYVKRETDWIGVALKEQKPFLGVCLGAQMMARHLGCKVGEHAQQHVEIGYHPIEATEHGKAITTWPNRVYQWHREGFEVPRGAKLLAKSEGSFQNQAYSVGPCAIGLQFHPEITHAMVCRWTGHNMDRLSQPGAQLRPHQFEDHIVHGPRVRHWLDQLLRRLLTGRLDHDGTRAR